MRELELKLEPYIGVMLSSPKEPVRVPFQSLGLAFDCILAAKNATGRQGVS
jgi:hypothetical protein